MYRQGGNDGLYFIIPAATVDPILRLLPPRTPTTPPPDPKQIWHGHRAISSIRRSARLNLSYGTITSIRTSITPMEMRHRRCLQRFQAVTTSVFYSLTGYPAALFGPVRREQSHSRRKATSPTALHPAWSAALRGARGLTSSITPAASSRRNLADRGVRVPAVYYNPMSIRPIPPRQTRTDLPCSDSPGHNAWGGWGGVLGWMPPTNSTNNGNSTSLWRYDPRSTPEHHGYSGGVSCPVTGGSAFTGEVLKATFSGRLSPKPLCASSPADY